jgi:hypothetical protein
MATGNGTFETERGNGGETTSAFRQKGGMT